MHGPEAAVSAATRLAELEASLNAVIRGKADVIRMSVVCLLSRGHLLIEDVPGVGKTTLAQALARTVSCGFQRLQCTADMLPGDILGVTIYNARTGEFEFKPGPIFTSFLLADEINRATPKTQSALLEAMNERQISIDGHTYPMAEPFLVIATQNPVEHHGTYPLPESQLDRFLMRLRIGYPDRASEREILRQSPGVNGPAPQAILTPEELLSAQLAAERVSVDESLVSYMLSIVEATRSHESLLLGVSPRGAQALYRAVQALALLEGRDYVLPDDIKRLAVPVFAHRVVLNQRVSLSNRSTETAERLLAEILNRVEVPL
ncbi:AAA family ATPase [Paludibaculum fermentans]|uniref:MoxR family ATPase n=1 Tax=Paludibaculum fermentans TaxID=1473598 RepID=A0A7S7NSY0_PALFE|nr:MoxR family ATPase [Paludibaculum fermentans]QOY89251.1 MoxR family ATPase [Paludibaculum fermentans]